MSRRIFRVAAVAIGALACAAARPAAAQGSTQNAASEYALVVEGNTVMSLRLQEAQDGQLGGSVAVAGKTLSVTGSARGGKLVFVTPSADGSLMHWEAVPQGGGELAVTLVPPGVDGRPDYANAQQHRFSRRAVQAGVGGSATASQWVVRLAAVADSVISWCAEPWVKDTPACQSALRIIRRAGPALMVARFATSGKAVALVNTLRGGATHATPALASAAAPPPPAQASESTASAPSFLAAVAPPSAPAATPAVDASGEYVGTVQGLGAPLVVRFAAAAGAGGTVTGAVTVGDASMPLTGTLSGERIAFTTPAPTGEVGHWEGFLHGDQLVVTLTAPNGRESYVLTRRR